MIKTAFLAASLLTAGFCAFILADDSLVTEQRRAPSINVPANPDIDYGGFVEMATDLQELRESRRVPIAQFLAMAQEPNTIILDTRSRAAYDDVHIAGAIHLNFSDFTVDKLRDTIPSKQTRILIYCNNNFMTRADQPATKPSTAKTRQQQERQTLPSETVETEHIVLSDGSVAKLDDAPALRSKSSPLALNIPTFIDLHGYGYENVYELADRLHVSDERITFDGRLVSPSP